MLKWTRIALVGALAGAAGLAWAIEPPADPKAGKSKCTCEQMKKDGMGWCDAHKTGIACGHEISNGRLYQLLAGAEVNKDELAKRCPNCAAALEKDGRCDSCKIGYRKGRAYRSAAVYAVSKGDPISRHDVKCEACAKLIAVGKAGWCDRCKRGVVLGRSYADRADFDAAAKGADTINKALDLDAKCRGCAVATLTDTPCMFCEAKKSGPRKVEGNKARVTQGGGANRLNKDKPSSRPAPKPGQRD